MIQTTIYIPDSLHRRLLLTAQVEGKSLTALIRELLEQALGDREHLKGLYPATKE